MLVSSTCSLNLGLAPEGKELTMETMIAVCSGSQENEKHIETHSVSRGEAPWAPWWWNKPDNRAGQQSPFQASVFSATRPCIMYNLSGNFWESILWATQALPNNRCTQPSSFVLIELYSDNWGEERALLNVYIPPPNPGFHQLLFLLLPLVKCLDFQCVPFQLVCSCCTFSLIQHHRECPSILAQQHLLGWKTRRPLEKQGLGVREWVAAVSASSRQMFTTLCWCRQLVQPSCLPLSGKMRINQHGLVFYLHIIWRNSALK